MKIYTGDLKPDLRVVLSDATPDGGVDVGVANAVRIIGKRNGEIIFDRAPSTTQTIGDESLLTMEWQAGDTDDAGFIQLEVEVTWPGNKKQTFRPSGGVNVATDFDLGSA
jgi:hypothetical protein